MSCMKAFAECVSVSMGLDGEITDDVIAESSRRLEWVEKANRMTLDFVSLTEVGCTCAECDDDYCGDWRIDPDNRLLCTSCFDDQYFTCCDCEEVADNDEATACGGGQLCESCAENYFTCDHCDELTPDDDGTAIGDEQWCPSCRRRDASLCSDCGSWAIDDNMISCGHGSVCMSCYEDSFFTCDRCNEVCHNDNYGEEGRCEDCAPDDPDSIMDYSTDILDVIRVKIDSSKVYYGVELEVVATLGDAGDAACDARTTLGENFVIMKHDSSLGSGGFEIVTVPASLRQHAKRWNAFLDNPPRGLRSWETHGKCGMHVHVSRAPLSQLTIGKILVFVNADANKSFIVGIAGRENPCYADISPKTIGDVKRYYGRGAINLGNSDTIEFRIFKGTLKKTSFLKNLEFVAACVRFCRFTGINQLDVPSFLAWFAGFRKDYPNLDSWLVSRGHIKPRSKPNKKASV